MGKNKKAAGISTAVRKTPIENVVVVNSGHRAEDIKEVMERAAEGFAKANDLTGQLDDVETWCRGIVESSTDPLAVEYANKTLTNLGDLRRALKSGPVSAAALAGIRVGKFSEQLRIQTEGPWIVGRKKAIDALNAAGVDKQACIDSVLRQFDKLHQQAPERALGSIEREVARGSDVALRTLHRWRAKRQ